MRIYVERDDVVPAAGGATANWAIGYMSADMMHVTDWHGAVIGSAYVKTSWRIDGSCLSDRMYQVECVVDGTLYTGRTLGASMLWKGKRVKRDRVEARPFAKSDRGMARRNERRAVLEMKGC